MDGTGQGMDPFKPDAILVWLRTCLTMSQAWVLKQQKGPVRMSLCEMAQKFRCGEVARRYMVLGVIVGLGLVHEEWGDLQEVACMDRHRGSVDCRWVWKKRNW